MRMQALKPPFRVLFIDDHKFMAESLAQRLAVDRSIEIVGIVARGAAAEKIVAEQTVDIVLLDMELEQEDGLGIARALLARKPALRLVGLSAHDRDHYPLSMLQLGAAGFLSKRASVREISDALRRVAAGEVAVSAEVATWLATQRVVVGPGDALANLTPKEREVLGLLAVGLTVEEIAERLALTCKTVQTHRNSLRKKLGVKTDVELCLLAIKAGLVDIHRIEVGARPGGVRKAA